MEGINKIQRLFITAYIIIAILMAMAVVLKKITLWLR
jgi:hypothetical protein